MIEHAAAFRNISHSPQNAFMGAYYVEKVKSPKTGRLIKLDGPAFQRLSKAQQKKAKASKRVTRPARKAPRKQRVSLSTIKKLKKTVNAAVTTGVAGWEKNKPKLRSDRRRKLEQCGSGCFLMPKQLKFPICPKNSCAVDCKALLAAKIRARQWGYSQVGRAADRIARMRKCAWTKRSMKNK